MKKIFVFLFFTAVLLLPNVVKSQPVVVPVYERIAHAFMPSNVDKTIIRSCQGAASISYYETAYGHFFLYYDSLSSNAVSLPIQMVFSVNDFMIDGEDVYFCGTTNSSTGLWGHFRICQFFFGTREYEYSNFLFPASGGFVKTFKRIELLSSTPHPKMALIGTGSATSLVVELVYNPVIQNLSYRMGEVDALYNESIEDIVVTDNYVVTLGYLMSGTEGHPCMRVFLRNNMFSANGPQNVLHEYLSNTPVVSDFDTGQIVSSHLDADYFAVGSFWRGPNSSYNEGTYIGIYEVEKMGNTFVPRHDTSMITNQVNYSSSWRLRGMTGYDLSSYFYLLQNADIVDFGFSSIVFELDLSMFLNPTGSIVVRVRDDAIMQSIDTSGYNYIANGFYAYDKTRLEFETGMPGHYNCTNRRDLTTASASMLRKAYPYALYTSSSSGGYGTSATSSLIVTVVTECFEQ